jgi:hypothetical protein
MAVAVTNSPIADFNTLSALTPCPATSSTLNEAEVFTITPTRADHRVVLEIYNGPTHGTVTWSIAAGGFPQSGAALTGDIAQDTQKTIMLDAKYKSATGTYVITFTPATGKRLLTDHAMGMRVIELPF